MVAKNIMLARAKPQRIDDLRMRDRCVQNYRDKRPVEATEADVLQKHYQIAVKLDGREGLLVDTGSPGNIQGDEWLLTQTAKAAKEGMQVTHILRERPLSISGVGHGSQLCSNDHQVPIALEARMDHSGYSKVSRNVFDAPTVPNSDLPGILGLRSMTEGRTILDLTHDIMI